MVYAKGVTEHMRKSGVITTKEGARIMTMLRVMSDIFFERIFNVTITLPANIGTIYIHRELPKNPMRKLPFHRKHLMPGHEYDVNKRAYNPKTGGYVYSFRIRGDKAERRHLNIKMDSKFRKKLFNELYYGDLANTI